MSESAQPIEILRTTLARADALKRLLGLMDSRGPLELCVTKRTHSGKPTVDEFDLELGGMILVAGYNAVRDKLTLEMAAIEALAKRMLRDDLDKVQEELERP